MAADSSAPSAGSGSAERAGSTLDRPGGRIDAPGAGLILRAAGMRRRRRAPRPSPMRHRRPQGRRPPPASESSEGRRAARCRVRPASTSPGRRADLAAGLVGRRSPPRRRRPPRDCGVTQDQSFAQPREEAQALAGARSGELQSASEVALGRHDVEAQRPLPGAAEQRIVGATSDGGQLVVAGRASEIERRHVVVGEDLGELVGAVADLPLDPVGGGLRACGLAPRAAAAGRRRRAPGRARTRTRPRPPSTRLRRGRTRSRATSSAMASSTSSAPRPASAATPPPQKVSPMTAASQSSALCSAGSVSRRAASTACTVSGRGKSASAGRRGPSSVRTRKPPVEQQAHVLLGVERVAADEVDDPRARRPSRAPASRRSATSDAASAASRARAARGAAHGRRRRP